MTPLLFALIAVDVAGMLLGIYAMRSRSVSGRFTTISAGVMLGVALFWIVPDMREKSGMVYAALAVGGRSQRCIRLTGLYTPSVLAARMGDGTTDYSAVIGHTDKALTAR